MIVRAELQCVVMCRADIAQLKGQPLRNFLCKAAKGLCGKRGVCGTSHHTNVVISDWETPKQNCSRSACISDKCEKLYKVAKKACGKLKGYWKQICLRSASVSRVACIDGCNALCRNPKVV